MNVQLQTKLKKSGDSECSSVGGYPLCTNTTKQNVQEREEVDEEEQKDEGKGYDENEHDDEFDDDDEEEEDLVL